MQVDYIDAKFGGDSVRFRLDRRYAYLFERSTGLFFRFRRFGSGEWTYEDLRFVLSFAHPKNVVGICAEVEDVLMRSPIHRYLPLAVLIVEAFLFGIDESKAVFDEGASGD